MKMKVLFLLTLLISEIFACGDHGESLIKKNTEEIAKRLPTMITELGTNRKECKTEKLKPVCSKGFKYWNSVTESHYYKGVYSDEDNLRGFLDVIFEGFPFTRQDSENIKDVLMMLSFTDGIDLLGLETLFDRASIKNSGTFFNMVFEQSCENYGEYDFLISSINSQFDLEDNILLMEYSSGWFWNKKSGYEVVREPASLSYDQATALMELLELSAYENADRIVRLLDGL